MSGWRHNERRGTAGCSTTEGSQILGTVGRSSVAVDFVDSLAVAKARDSPRILHRMLAVSCVRSFAVSLVSGGDAWSGTDGRVPDLADLFHRF